MAIDAALGRLGIKQGVCTSSTRPTNPFEGQVIYESDTNRTLVYDNAAWVVIANASSTTFPTSLDTNTVDSIAALQAKVGVNGSAVTSSLDYKISNTHNVPRVLAYRATDQALNSLTYNTILFDAEAYDTHGMHSTTTNTSRLTVPTGWDGYYLLTAGGAINTSTLSITFLVNSIRFGYSGQLATVGGGSFLIPANAGAYFEWSGYSQSATTIYGTSSIGGYASSFSAVWVAPL